MPVRWTSPSRPRDLLPALAAGLALSLVGAPQQGHAQGTGDDVLFVSFEVNGRTADLAAVVHRRNGDYLIRDADLAALRLIVPEGPGIEIDGDIFRPLSALHPAKVTLDETRQVLILEVPPAAMQASAVNLGRRMGALPTSSDWSLFLNYDSTVNSTDTGTVGSGAVEAALAGPYGTFLTSGLGQLRLDGGGDSRSEDHGLRLETSYTYDDPAAQTRFRLGDSISGYSTFGRQIRFGGVQFSSDFDLRPGQFTFAAPGLSGYLDNASTVALYIDNVLRYTGDLPAGPFSFADLPVTTGAGETRLVVTDLLGREQVVTSSYYVSADSLAAGKREFSYEFGARRKNYGSASDDYGAAFAAATHRLGLTDWLTAEAHGEWESDRWQAGLTGVVVLPRVGQLSGTYARSDSEQLGEGWLWNAGFQRLGSLGSLSLLWERASDGFSQFDSDLIDPEDARLIGRAQANAGLTFGRLGNLSVGYGRLRYSDGTTPEVATATYSVRLTDRTTINLIGAETHSGATGTDERRRSVALTWTTVLAPRRSTNLQVQQSGGTTTGSVDYHQQRDGLYGFDYTVRGDFGDEDTLNRAIGRLDLATHFGDFAAIGSADSTREALQLSASGGLVAAGGGLFPSERIYDAAAVVTVPDYPGVTVYKDNQPVGKTGEDGRLLIPNVRAYEENEIRLEPSDLPIDATVSSDRVLIVPRARGAVVARFPVKRQASAVVVVTRADGSYPPAGATVTFEGGVDPSFTGYDGEVFVSDLSQPVTGTIAFNGILCRFEAPAKPADSEALPRLGPVACREEAP
ncbi:fimbria/pilus outer membrane usher protein [Zavarzinia sp.]|uniref:fimbria/pilus outer membrane usher protein n=1 Tax=Zavarzinia sp. TaxID=2027920 RepID=UPI0035682A07